MTSPKRKTATSAPGKTAKKHFGKAKTTAKKPRTVKCPKKASAPVLPQTPSSVQPQPQFDTLCKMIIEHQRSCVFVRKERMAAHQRITAFVANANGYFTGDDEKSRKAAFAKAEAEIKRISAEGNNEEHKLSGLIRESQAGADRWYLLEQTYLGHMEAAALRLPGANWIDTSPDCKGIGLRSFATIIGEAGNLSNYSNPSKLWKRLGLAPITSKGKTQMGATWRSRGGLSAEEWKEAGYSPRRAGQAALAEADFCESLAKKMPAGEQVENVFSIAEIQKQYLKSIKKLATHKIDEMLAEQKKREEKVSKRNKKQSTGGSREHRVAADAA